MDSKTARIILAAAAGTAVFFFLGPLLPALALLANPAWRLDELLAQSYKLGAAPALVAGLLFSALTAADNYPKPGRLGAFFAPLRRSWLLGALLGACVVVVADEMAYHSHFYLQAVASAGAVLGALLGPVARAAMLRLLPADPASGAEATPPPQHKKMRPYVRSLFRVLAGAAIGVALGYFFMSGQDGGHIHPAKVGGPSAPGDAQAGDGIVARVFGKPVRGDQLRAGELFVTTSILRGLILPEALGRFIAANRLQATDADFAAYARYQTEYRGIVGERRARDLAQIESQLASRGTGAEERARLERRKESLGNSAKFAAERAIVVPTDPQWRSGIAPIIEREKAHKALYEKYGGAVSPGDPGPIGNAGPYPLGAIGRLLREHERAGDIEVLDPKLRDAFWRYLERTPRYAAWPERIDFTYYWLRPVETRWPWAR